MKNIITLLLALVLLLGASALADDRADMLVAAAVNELGYSATKGGYSKYGEWGGSAYGEWCSEFVSWCGEFRRRILWHVHAWQRLSLADQLRGRLDVV